jgi:glycosyltransferase involved in cell wall biosynthesis
MNAGKAVVVSDRVGCAPDLVIDGQNGRIFPVGNTTALADALQWGIAHAVSAGEMSLKQIQTWSYNEDLQGLKNALENLRTRSA